MSPQSFLQATQERDEFRKRYLEIFKQMQQQDQELARKDQKIQEQALELKQLKKKFSDLVDKYVGMTHVSKK